MKNEITCLLFKLVDSMMSPARALNTAIRKEMGRLHPFLLFPILVNLCKNLRSKDLFSLFYSNPIIRGYMVAIAEVRNRILSINLRNFNIKSNGRLNEWIMKLEPNLVELRLKEISTPVSPDFFPCLQALGITLTNSSLSPIIYPTNCSIKKLIIENQTIQFIPVYDLLQKFRKNRSFRFREMYYNIRFASLYTKIFISSYIFFALYRSDEKY